MADLSQYKGRIVSITSHTNAGAWDNFAIAEFSYFAVVLSEDGKSVTEVFAGDSEHEAPKIDATPENLAAYDAMMREKYRIYREEEAERQRNSPAYGKVMEVLKGKNKGFVGTVKWLGSTKFGESALLINERGEKVFTKPHNLKLIAEAAPEPEIKVGSKVTVKMGTHAGKSGTVDWVGETKYGYKARVKATDGTVVWAKPGNLILSDESEVRSMIA